MKFNWKQLYRALDDHRKEAGGESWRSLATRSGVTPSLFTRISKGQPTNVGNLLKLMDILKDRAILNFVEFKKTRG